MRMGPVHAATPPGTRAGGRAFRTTAEGRRRALWARLRIAWLAAAVLAAAAADCGCRRAANDPGVRASPERRARGDFWLLPAILLALGLPGLLLWGRDGADAEPGEEETPAPAPARAATPARDLLRPALSRIEERDPAGAIPVLQSVIRREPALVPRARVLLALCVLRTGLPDVAAEEIADVPLEDVPLGELHDVAVALDDAGHPEAARSIYRAILRADIQFRDVAQRVRSRQRETPVRPDSLANARATAHHPSPRATAATTGSGAGGPAGGLRPPSGAPFGARYRDVRFLAQGGMGVVYRAHDSELDRAVAIKMLSPAYQQDQEFVERFFRESRAMARLAHPGIVAVHDVARSPVPFIVMEFLEGRSLRRVLTEDGRLPLDAALPLALTIVEAVAFAHGQGIVHRDLKPENVMVSPGGAARLLDFGLARLSSERAITRPLAMMGTPDYMAPELGGGSEPSPASDVFSLAVILSELLAGITPRTAHGGPLPPWNATSGISVALHAVIQRALAHDPAVRPPGGAGEIASVLRAEIERRSAPPAPAGAADLAAFRRVHAWLDEAYTHTLHGLKASLGVYKRCENEPAKVFQYLLNADGIGELAHRVRAMEEGVLASLRAVPAHGACGACGADELDRLAAEVGGRDWGALVGELSALARSADRSVTATAAARDRLRAAHVEVAGLCARLAACLDSHRVRLEPLVRAVVEASLARERITCAATGDPSILVPDPPRLAADLRVILENLLNNAFEAQSTRVEVTLEAEAGTVRLRVHDDGVGIAPERLPLIFESGETTKTTGTGTGLVRVRSLAAAHHGTAAAESRPGTGSTFTVTLAA
jgi:serine/threonine-protein kinase